VLSNADGAHFTESVAFALEKFAGLSAPTQAPSFPVDPSTFVSLAKTYQDDFNIGRVVVTTTANGLSISLPDVEAAGIPYDPKLVAIAPDNFVLEIQGIQTVITFLRDSNGDGEYIRHRAFVAKRTDTAVARKVDARALRSRLNENAVRERLVLMPALP
jgi:hypothetical protein